MTAFHNIAKKYAKKSKGFIPYHAIPATTKYVEVMLDLGDLTRFVHKVSFTDRASIMALMDQLERKADYYKRHKNFELARAITLLNAARRGVKK